MEFSLLPALDLTSGRLGRFTPDGPRPSDAFGGDPLSAARAYVGAGAHQLHVVDLDLAFGGEPTNLPVVRELATNTPEVAIQASGQIRTEAQVRAYLEAGARRVVLGSASLVDQDLVGTLVSGWKDSLTVGIDVEGGRVRSRGADRVDLDLLTTLGWLHAIGAPRFLVTSVSRVDSMSGPDVELVRQVARTGVPVLAAGGIRSIDDLSAIRRAGAIGAVVGRSALEGDLDLAEALGWASGNTVGPAAI
jgi:phosphoribosylformimino-5-aminoimidazole carboxamide ribonucleotide (ProFAR) isomerase